MLEAARLALCDAGVLAASAPMPPFALRMSGNFVFIVHPDGPAFFVVKVGVLTELDREFAGLNAAHAVFPETVPRPIALSRHRGFPTLVCSGIRFAPLGNAALRHARPRLARAFADHFRTTARAFRTSCDDAHSKRMLAAGRRYATAVPTPAWSGYVAAVADEADRLPTIAQHGDFYQANLGERNGRLVVLDWEDFGRECLPGLDLALLLLSLNGWAALQVAASVRRDGPHAWLLAAGWSAAGLPESLFLRLLPAYVMLVARMKDEQGYGDEFRQRALAALPGALRCAEQAGATLGPR